MSPVPRQRLPVRWQREKPRGVGGANGRGGRGGGRGAKESESEHSEFSALQKQKLSRRGSERAGQGQGRGERGFLHGGAGQHTRFTPGARRGAPGACSTARGAGRSSPRRPQAGGAQANQPRHQANLFCNARATRTPPRAACAARPPVAAEPGWLAASVRRGQSADLCSGCPSRRLWCPGSRSRCRSCWRRRLPSRPPSFSSSLPKVSSWCRVVWCSRGGNGGDAAAAGTRRRLKVLARRWCFNRKRESDSTQ